MDYTINPEEMRRIQAFLDGTAPDVIFTDLPGKCYRLAEAMKSKCLDEARKAVASKKSLERRIEKIQASKERQYLEGKFAEANRDSLEVAYAIKYVANSNNIFIKRTLLIPVLYDVYANWLYSQKEILTTEEPKAIESGPQFWRVYNKIDMKMPASETKQYYDSIVAFNPGVIAIIKNVLRKYIDIDERRVAAIMKNNDAYRNADKDHNCGKWNKVIEPKDIYLWKKDANNK